MTEYEDDLRTFIRWQTAQVDRSYRDSAKVIREALDRNNEALERNGRAFDRVMAALDDHADESRAFTSLLFELIDEIRGHGGRIDELKDRIDRLLRRMGPDEGTAPA